MRPVSQRPLAPTKLLNTGRSPLKRTGTVHGAASEQLETARPIVLPARGRDVSD